MRSTILLAGVAGIVTLLTHTADAKFTTLYAFTGGSDGSGPEASLARDASGNLYGTTNSGGAHNRGTVFKLRRDGAETVLHSFGDENDGADPGANVILDNDGNLYGTTIDGGGTGCGGNGCGTVFKIAPDGTETVLYAFKDNHSDGVHPYWGLTRDGDGNLYGTTTYGGQPGGIINQGCGIVFKIRPNGTEKIIYAFIGGNDAGNPNSNLIRDDAGNLYGAALWSGGPGNDGAIFKLAPDGTESLLYSATPDSFSPAGLSNDIRGNFYTTVQGGDFGYGAVLKLAPNGTTNLAYSFKGGRDGDTSLFGVVVDAAQNLYGTTIFGGGIGCGGFGCGTVFKISADGIETVLHRFKDVDNGPPDGGVILDRHGRLYGTTFGGGAGGLGIVFRVSQ